MSTTDRLNGLLCENKTKRTENTHSRKIDVTCKKNHKNLISIWQSIVQKNMTGIVMNKTSLFTKELPMFN